MKRLFGLIALLGLASGCGDTKPVDPTPAACTCPKDGPCCETCKCTPDNKCDDSKGCQCAPAPSAEKPAGVKVDVPGAVNVQVGPGA